LDQQDVALNQLGNSVLTAVLSLAACVPGSLGASSDRPGSIAAVETPEMALANQRLADAMKLVGDKYWTPALAALTAITKAKGFSALSADFQYRTLSTAAKVAFDDGQPGIARDYLKRVLAMPQAGYEDWYTQLRAAIRLEQKLDAVNCWTSIAQKWPERLADLPDRSIYSAVTDAKALKHDVALRLLQALYKAHWNPPWPSGPSGIWRDLALLLLERDRVPEAIGVSTAVSDPYVLIAIRADRRFDAVTAANPAMFDIAAAAEREMRERRRAAENAPDSLALRNSVIVELRQQQRYAEMLAEADSVLQELKSTNSPEKIFKDYKDQYPWLLEYRARALKRLHRWDEALEQLTAASQINVNGRANVSQLINLAALDNALGRPEEVLAHVRGLDGSTNALGMMRIEKVRLEAAVQLGDKVQAARALSYLKEHRADSLPFYQWSLIVANELEQASKLLISRLRDKDQRQDALQSVQRYAAEPGPEWDQSLGARWRAVLDRPEVQAAILQVGRVESYPLEEN
jgi:hypothetical protein